MMRAIAILALVFLAVAASAAEDREVSEVEVIALERAAHAGDKAAIVALFNARADGAVAEEIDIALGSLIRSNPNLFLESLSQSWRANCDACLPGLVGNTGDALVDRFDDQMKELKKRRAALEGVNNQALLSLRAKCLTALDADIREVASAIQSEAGGAK